MVRSEISIYANGVTSSSRGLSRECGATLGFPSPPVKVQPQRGCVHGVTSRDMDAKRKITHMAVDRVFNGLGELK